MTLRHLTIFRAVCQTESITLAAEHLNMTQPAVSLTVRELEDFYGVQLFERMNRRIYITEAGRTLLQYADTILSQYAESVQVLQEARHRGSCRFGVHVTFGETVLPSLLRRLVEQLPYITVRAFVTNTRENEEMLLRNELDFAVIDNVKGLEALRTVPLGKEEMAVVCRPDHRSGNSITLEELAGERLLLREKGHFVSGEAVSAELGFTRAAIWKSISALRAQGYEIDAVTGRGYCLKSLPDTLTEQTVRSYLGPVETVGKRIDCFDSIDSTNAYLKRIALDGAPEEIFTHAAELREMGLGIPGAAALAEELRARGAAVRPVPRAVERVLRLRLPHVAGHPRVGVQYAAVHHLPARARLYVQELPRPQGRRHPVRQGQPLSAHASFRTPVKQDGGAFFVWDA